MLKVSTKTRYGMRFMIDLTQHAADGRVALKDVAERQGISKKYLEQVVSPLAAAGLLVVTRGQGGGYELSRPPEEITLAEIVDASENGIGLIDCTSGEAICDRQDDCVSLHIWSGLENAIRAYLEGRTLADAVSGVVTTAECPQCPATSRFAKQRETTKADATADKGYEAHYRKAADEYDELFEALS